MQLPLLCYPHLQILVHSVQFSSVAQSCLTLCDPMNRSTPGLPVHHQLPEFTQTHVHRVSDAIQPSHSLLSPSPPALNPSQHQGLFQWVNSSHEVANSFVPKSDFCLLSSARLYSFRLHHNLRSVSRKKTKAIRRLSLCFGHQLPLLSSKSASLMREPSLYSSFISSSQGSQSSAICCLMSKKSHLIYFPQFYSCLQ